MTTLMNERIKRYSNDDIKGIIQDEDLTSDDMSYLTAISNFAIVATVPGEKEGKLAGLKPVEIPVFLVYDHYTGIYREPGQYPIIFLNEEASILDYDFISELHPQHDWEVYLWLAHRWSDADSDLGIHGEWYRRDVYPDGMTPFTGELGWEDRAPVEEEN